MDGMNLYGYIPTKEVCACFLTLYGLTTLVHVFQASYYWKRATKFMFLTAVLCGFIDAIGWGARFASATEGRETLFMPWVIQYLATFLAPTPLLATDFVVFGRLIRELGECYSWLRPRMYSIMFLSFDILAILIQVGGGAIAGTAAGSDEEPTTGSNIMLAGIIFQMFAMVVFMIAVTEYSWRYFRDKPVHTSRTIGQNNPEERRFRGELTPKRRLAWGLIATTTLLLFIRGVYRLVEFIDGWGGPIYRNETLLNLLDGAPVLLALVLWNIGHPGRLLMASGNESPEKYQLLRRGSPTNRTRIENASEANFIGGHGLQAHV